MNSGRTCILVLVSMLTTRSCEYTQKYQYSSNNLMTDFRNLSNRKFLFINCSLRVVFSLFPKFSWVAKCDALWHATHQRVSNALFMPHANTNPLNQNVGKQRKKNYRNTT